jgi:hypothetical protein
MSKVNYFISNSFFISCSLYYLYKSFFSTKISKKESRNNFLTNNKGGKSHKLSANIGLTYGIARHSLGAYKCNTPSGLLKESCQILGPRFCSLIFAVRAAAFALYSLKT